MAFDVIVETSLNGRPSRMVLGGVAESGREAVEQDIAWFREGRKPMEGLLGYNIDSNTKSAVRWADVKNIWIEER